MSNKPSTPNPIWGLLRLVVVVAAAAGGWFAYDEYIAEDPSIVAAQNAADTTATPPWPADLVAAEQAWSGNTRSTVNSADGTTQLQIDTHASSGRVKYISFDAAGSELFRVETDGVEIWGKGTADLAWVDVNTGTTDFAAELKESSLDIAYTLSAPTLYEIVPPETWEHTLLVSDDIDSSGVRTLHVRIKGAAFADQSPALAAQWRLASVHDDGIGPADVRIGLDADGHVLSVEYLTDGTGDIRRFAEVPEDPIFESPLAD